MKRLYSVVKCTRCQQFLLSRQGTKTRRCPYCGAKIDLSRAEIHWTTEDPEEARSILRSRRQTDSGAQTTTKQ